MQALAKILRARQASTHLIFASNSSKGQILRALLNWMGPLDTYEKIELIFQLSTGHQEVSELSNNIDNI